MNTRKSISLARKLLIYKAAIEFIKNPVNQREGAYKWGICKAIYDITGSDDPDSYYLDLYNYPELHRHKPKKCSGYWFEVSLKGTDKRIKILQAAVASVEKQIQKQSNG